MDLSWRCNNWKIYVVLILLSFHTYAGADYPSIPWWCWWCTLGLKDKHCCWFHLMHVTSVLALKHARIRSLIEWLLSNFLVAVTVLSCHTVFVCLLPPHSVPQILFRTWWTCSFSEEQRFLFCRHLHTEQKEWAYLHVNEIFAEYMYVPKYLLSKGAQGITKSKQSGVERNG